MCLRALMRSSLTLTTNEIEKARLEEKKRHKIINNLVLPFSHEAATPLTQWQYNPKNYTSFEIEKEQ